MIKNILITLCIIGLTACSSSKGDSDNQNAEYNACIGKGVKYYKMIGSYPTLSTGENADSKIREKCDFNIKVFD